MTKHPEVVGLTSSTLRQVYSTNAGINAAAETSLRAMLGGGGLLAVTPRFGAVLEIQTFFGIRREICRRQRKFHWFHPAVMPKLISVTHFRWRKVSFPDEPHIGFELTNGAVNFCEMTRADGKLRVVFGPYEVAYALSVIEFEALLPEGRRLLEAALLELETSPDWDQK